MRIEDYNKASELILEMQRINETINHLFKVKNEENENEYKDSWNIEINGFSTTLTDDTFRIIVKALNTAYSKVEEELAKL